MFARGSRAYRRPYSPSSRGIKGLEVGSEIARSQLPIYSPTSSSSAIFLSLLRRVLAPQRARLLFTFQRRRVYVAHTAAWACPTVRENRAEQPATVSVAVLVHPL
ncbi:hypothetical protein BOTBODRAFT_25853 [Botryobasidium botryosum FD-172 SS1]|uniref:Uncharacterized protein n=1 Tax=Botryobasidium botryosum (strain FD-172 SS1) TaxID=930990 RepID=A0A067NBC6_BOTB1|nr:hypothetical protein BOTBODRAFT_25853 [Botryobasidium botryosum FD-172 SS1]